MSIPKEPRQLMINLMYLVLTALLALNVSAEVMNAFKTIDESLVKSNVTTNKAIDDQQNALSELLSDKSKEKFKPLGVAVTDIRAEIQAFNDEIAAMKDNLIVLLVIIMVHWMMRIIYILKIQLRKFLEGRRTKMLQRECWLMTAEVIS